MIKNSLQLNLRLRSIRLFALSAFFYICFLVLGTVVYAEPTLTENKAVKDGTKTQLVEKQMTSNHKKNENSNSNSSAMNINKDAELEQTVTLQHADRLTQAEIQKAMGDMKRKLNVRIEAWGKKLTRRDFEKVQGKVRLKYAKKLEVCQIFQSVIDETYQLALKNKHRLSPADQQNVGSRNDFIQALGFKDNIVRTEMGFDCRIK